MIKKQKAIRFDSTFLKKILNDVRIPKKIGLKKCIQCGNCTSACPAARYTSYRPRKFIHDILTNQKEKILESEDLWYCFSCFSCNLRCPRSNNPGILIHVIRNHALLQGYGWKKVLPFKNYLISLMNFGLGLTPFSVPTELFEEELGAQWKKMRQNLPELLKQLGMNPVAPRELPQDARNQIKKILELAGINQKLKKFENMEQDLEQ
ncbi:MAG: 4Fe-4S dicluster domain-containing protein [Candidatus Helarchaeota archaeon]|nr:4Fe-4S dicluster domain-containing protein [Candidatus Helarchaeota archaeon]